MKIGHHTLASVLKLNSPTTVVVTARPAAPQAAQAALHHVLMDHAAQVALQVIVALQVAIPAATATLAVIAANVAHYHNGTFGLKAVFPLTKMNRC